MKTCASVIRNDKICVLKSILLCCFSVIYDMSHKILCHIKFICWLYTNVLYGKIL